VLHQVDVAIRRKEALTCQKMSRCCPFSARGRLLFVGPLFGSVHSSNELISFTNCLTLDKHKQESMHSGATFSTPSFSSPEFLTVPTAKFSAPAFSVAPNRTVLETISLDRCSEGWPNWPLYSSQKSRF